jgi:hypothetical protein
VQQPRQIYKISTEYVHSEKGFPRKKLQLKKNTAGNENAGNQPLRKRTRTVFVSHSAIPYLLMLVTNII